MKLIFVPYLGAFGGVERLILSLSAYLYHQSIAHKVICFRDTIGLDTYAHWPVVIEQLSPKRNSLAEARALRKYCDREVGSATGELLLFDLKGAFYAGLANLKGFHLHLTDPPSLLSVESSRHSRAYRRWSGEASAVPLARRLIGQAVQALNRRGVRRAKTVIVMTNRIAAELQALYSITPLVIRPGVSEVMSDLEASPPNRKSITMLSVSRLESSKRIEAAIDALAKLCSDTASSQDGASQDGTCWQLEVAGAGPAREELEAYAAKRKVAGSVKFLGRLSDEELDAAYRRASIFVMPAVQGYGLPALEALMRNVPVVLHRDSGVSEILQSTPWVEIIENTDQLSSAVRRISTRIQHAKLPRENQPAIPTDSQWADQITQACNWLS